MESEGTSKTVRISSKIKIQTSTDYTHFSRFLNDLEIVKDKYDGLISNRELIYFIFVTTALGTKRIATMGKYHEYEGSLNWVVKLSSKGLNLKIPTSYSKVFENSSVSPTFITDFVTKVEESSVTPFDAHDEFKSNLSNSLKKYKGIVESEIFKHFPLTISFESDSLKIEKED